MPRGSGENHPISPDSIAIGKIPVQYPSRRREAGMILVLRILATAEEALTTDSADYTDFCGEGESRVLNYRLGKFLQGPSKPRRQIYIGEGMKGNRRRSAQREDY